MLHCIMRQQQYRSRAAETARFIFITIAICIYSFTIYHLAIYIYREREREIDLGGGAPTHHSPSHIPYDLQPARNIIIPGHHLRYVYIHSLFINERSSYRNEQPGISINEPGGAEKPWHHTISLDLRLLAPGHHHALVRSHIARLGIMGIVAAIIITCDM